MADEENPTHAPGTLQTHSLTLSGDFQASAGVVTEIGWLGSWHCPECSRIYHRSFAGPQCPICHVDMKREVIDDTAPPSERVRLV
jgi:rubrerythrin